MYQYGDSYLEFVELSDGTNVLLRPIQPSDKAGIRHFHFELMADNVGMKRLIAHLHRSTLPPPPS